MRMQEQRGTTTGQSEYEKPQLPAASEESVLGELPAQVVLGIALDASEEAVFNSRLWRPRGPSLHPRYHRVCRR